MRKLKKERLLCAFLLAFVSLSFAAHIHAEEVAVNTENLEYCFGYVDPSLTSFVNDTLLGNTTMIGEFDFSEFGSDAIGSPTGLNQSNAQGFIYVNLAEYCFFWSCFDGVKANGTSDTRTGPLELRNCTGPASPSTLIPEVPNQLAVYANNLDGNASIGVVFKIGVSWYHTPSLLNYPSDSTISLTMSQISALNQTHNWRFVGWSDNSSDRTKTFNMATSQSCLAYYSLEPKGGDPGGWINFWIGFLGLGMMFSSWIFLKHYWDEDEYAKALGTWIALFTIGIGVFTIMLGA